MLARHYARRGAIRMNSRTSLVRFVVGVAAVLIAVGGCSPELAGPKPSMGPQLGVHSSNMILDQVWDDCGGGFYSCHFDDISYGDSNWSCPVGCHTYPLTSDLGTRINYAMARINRTLCGWAYSYISTALISGRIRYYSQSDGNDGDIHFSGVPGVGPGPDNQAFIHLWEPNTYNQNNLADTLVHEAYHAYFNSADEITAASTAATCVNTF
jgi:hypothetical protein